MKDDWVPIIPGKGQLKETATDLLRIAGDPKRVRTTGNGLEFLVPPDVAQEFTAPVPLAPARRPKSRTSRATPKED